MIQEYLRRLLNCSKELKTEDIHQHITKYNLDMLNAGHTEEFRASLTHEALNIYQERLDRPQMFRSKDEVQLAKSTTNKQDWFKASGNFDAV